MRHTWALSQFNAEMFAYVAIVSRQMSRSHGQKNISASNDEKKIQ